MPEMDAHTMKAVADLVRGRIARLPQNAGLDGMERLGAHRVLTQLAKDLDASAEFVRPSCTRVK